MEEEGPTDNDAVIEFATYEDFLDSQISALDLYYLEDEELARQLVELGYRGSGEVLKREEFEARKLAAEASKQSKKNQQQALSSSGKDLTDVFLTELAKREDANKSGKMTVGFLKRTFVFEWVFLDLTSVLDGHFHTRYKPERPGSIGLH